MIDERELQTFEKKLRKYEVAGAMYSYGDVVDFIEHGSNQGIIIADTCGHLKEFGDRARTFLRKEIESGWGSSYDLKTEILEFGRRLLLTGTGKPTLEERFSQKGEEWWDCIAFGCAQFASDDIYLTGLHNLIIRENGSIETPQSTLGPYHFEDPEGREPARTTLSSEDIMVMASDGLGINIGINSWLKGEKTGDETIQSKIAHIISENRTKDVRSIRDSIVSQLGDYFLPASTEWDHARGYDDVTFVIVKKNS